MLVRYFFKLIKVINSTSSRKKLQLNIGIFSHLSINYHKKFSLFSAACKNFCRVRKYTFKVFIRCLNIRAIQRTKSRYHQTHCHKNICNLPTIWVKTAYILHLFESDFSRFEIPLNCPSALFNFFFEIQYFHEKMLNGHERKCVRSAIHHTFWHDLFRFHNTHSKKYFWIFVQWGV